MEGELAVRLAVVGEDEAAGLHGFEEFHAEPLFVAEDDDDVDGGAEGGEFGVGHGAVVDGGVRAQVDGPEVARGLRGDEESEARERVALEVRGERGGDGLGSLAYLSDPAAAQQHADGVRAGNARGVAVYESGEGEQGDGLGE